MMAAKQVKTVGGTVNGQPVTQPARQTENAKALAEYNARVAQLMPTVNR